MSILVLAACVSSHGERSEVVRLTLDVSDDVGWTEVLSFYNDGSVWMNEAKWTRISPECLESRVVSVVESTAFVSHLSDTSYDLGGLSRVRVQAGGKSAVFQLDGMPSSVEGAIQGMVQCVAQVDALFERNSGFSRFFISAVH